MPKTSTFAKRLQELIDAKQISQAQLARDSGVSKSSITHYLKGDWEGKQDAVYSIARATSVSEAWLMGFDVPMDQSDHSQGEFGNYLPDNIIPMPNLRKVPRLGSIACGEPILAEQNIEGYDEVPDWVKCDFTLTCKGDSMINARIHDGDIVCIKSQPEVENGQIAAVLVLDSGEDGATLKRVRYVEGGVALWPENPAYEPMIYTGIDAERVRVLGLATHFIGKVV